MRKNQSSEEELAGGRLVGGSLFSLEGPEERLAGDYYPPGRSRTSLSHCL